MRTERYMHNGVALNQVYAIRIDPKTIAMLSRQGTQRIPAQYFVGTALHESGFAANEIDTEDSGFVTKGLYQIADSEANSIMKGANLFDVVMATLVFVRMQERALDTIRSVCAKYGKPCQEPDIWAYLAVKHNEGLGTYAPDGKGALGTICRNGVNWGNPRIDPMLDSPASYRRRNAGRPIVKYGDDVITGGARWRDDFVNG